MLGGFEKKHIMSSSDVKVDPLVVDEKPGADTTPLCEEEHFSGPSEAGTPTVFFVVKDFIFERACKNT